MFGKVSLCGKHVAYLDALWNGYTTYKYSLIENFLYHFDGGICPTNNRAATLTISHKYARENLDGRKNQKFKLVQVRICKQGISA